MESNNKKHTKIVAKYLNDSYKLLCVIFLSIKLFLSNKNCLQKQFYLGTIQLQKSTKKLSYNKN